jgi:hypothetical protein
VGLALLIVALAIATVVVVGPTATWRWIDARWRLDIGAPSATSPYPEVIGEAQQQFPASADAVRPSGEVDFDSGTACAPGVQQPA